MTTAEIKEKVVSLDKEINVLRKQEGQGAEIDKKKI